MLHLTKVAFGCASLEILTDRIIARAAGGDVRLTTRYRPKRHAEIIGGSLFWIVKHRLVARSEIRAFEDNAEGRIDIVLVPRLVGVRPHTCRAHQGWRYLEETEAPSDLSPQDPDTDTMPQTLYSELAALALI